MFHTDEEETSFSIFLTVFFRLSNEIVGVYIPFVIIEQQSSGKIEKEISRFESNMLGLDNPTDSTPHIQDYCKYNIAYIMYSFTIFFQL